MIQVTVKPRADNKFDVYVHAENGAPLMNSSQGYENVEDAERIARLCFGTGGSPVASDLHHRAEPTRLTVEYRDGTVKSELIR